MVPASSATGDALGTSIGVPVPASAGRSPMEYSAAVTLLLPVLESSPVASIAMPAGAGCRVTLGVSTGWTTVGPPASAPVTSTEVNGPQVAPSSEPCT